MKKVVDNNYYNNSRTEILSFLPSKYEKVLEIGCGEGKFRRNLDKNAEAWGVEIDEHSALIAKRHFKKVLIGNIERVIEQLPDEYFDLLICNDVLEHMSDPSKFLKKIRNKLKKDAYLVGSIPNVRHVSVLLPYLILKDWRYVKSGVLDNTHLRFFTKKSLFRFLDSNELLIEKIHGINSSISIKRNKIGAVISLLLVVISLGYYGDVQYLQYGFRTRFKAREFEDK